MCRIHHPERLQFVSIIALACAMPRPATYDHVVTTHRHPKPPAHGQDQTATVV